MLVQKQTWPGQWPSSRLLSLLGTTMVKWVLVLSATKRYPLSSEEPSSWPSFPLSPCRETWGTRLASSTLFHARTQAAVVLCWLISFLPPEALAFSLLLCRRSY
ncbi:rCG20469 [Rattus norvegicus]|uniref:RCG20469 n=1 Tax=Rattus norvegicus TaxID=10116 RepID=A6JH35_RAT|nr:rCG20469 [Rattus norvegicus]